MLQKVAGAYIEPYKIQTIDPNRSKENLTWVQDVLLKTHKVHNQSFAKFTV